MYPDKSSSSLPGTLFTNLQEFLTKTDIHDIFKKHRNLFLLLQNCTQFLFVDSFKCLLSTLSVSLSVVFALEMALFDVIV